MGRWKVQLFELNYGEEEGAAAVEVIRSRWITMGERVREFERQFSERVVDGAYCTAVSSGTAALHMSLLALGVGPGDEVIVPALTFVADINVVRIVGAKPVLVDCQSYNNWNISAEGISKALTENTKGVIVVHYAGYPCHMDEILGVCEGQRVEVIEDAAHAPGARYKGRAVGTWGKVGCFSFFSNKNLSVGEGGMFVTRDPEIDRKAKLLRCHGMTTVTLDRYKGRAISYDVVVPGLNYRLDEIRAAIGIAQLEKLKAGNSKRRAIVELYNELLSGEEKISVPFAEYKAGESAYHIYPVLLDSSVDRTHVIERMRSAGIETSIHYPAFESFTAYRGLETYEVPIARDISRRALTLPLHPGMSEADVRYVVENLRKAINA